MQSVKDASVYCTYLGHSGFLLELPEGTLIFDWRRSDLPPLREDRPIYVFISHLHKDHYQPRALDLVLRYPKVQVFLGYDYSDPKINDALDRLPKVIRDSVSCFVGEEKLVSDDGRLVVSTLESTDMGVAFLAGIGGRTYFHAGDLFLLQTLSAAQYGQWAAEVRRKAPGSPIRSYEGYLAMQRAAFEKDTEPLRGKIVDYGMLPMDPRFPEAAYRTVKRYMDIADFRAWSPMHLWDQNDFADAFLTAHPEYADNAAAPVRQAQAMKRIRVGVSFRLFGPDGEPDRSHCSDVPRKP